jgi:hypothetical protein
MALILGPVFKLTIEWAVSGPYFKCLSQEFPWYPVTEVTCRGPVSHDQDYILANARHRTLIAPGVYDDGIRLGDFDPQPDYITIRFDSDVAARGYNSGCRTGDGRPGGCTHDPLEPVVQTLETDSGLADVRAIGVATYPPANETMSVLVYRDQSGGPAYSGDPSSIDNVDIERIWAWPGEISAVTQDLASSHGTIRNDVPFPTGTNVLITAYYASEEVTTEDMVTLL